MADLDPVRLDAVLKALRSIEGDLSLPLLLTLFTVAREPGISVTELGDRAGTPQQTASRHIAILQGRYQMPGGAENAFAKDPLLSLEISTDDPRRRALFLTLRGKDRLADILNQLYAPEAAPKL